VVHGKMIPLVQPFVTKIDIDAKRIDVELPAGLLDD
jgi:ribosomal 30S subunit maturation factor RimM